MHPVLIAILMLLAFIAGFLVIYGIVFLISALCVKKGKIYDKHSSYYRFLIDFTSVIIMLFCNIRTRLLGEEKLPKDSRFVLICNHRSGYDPIITFYKLRKYKLSFLSKPENFNLFLYGRIIQKCCFLPIDREDPKKAMRAILKAADYIKDDQVSIGIYPEGTRAKDCIMKPFHNGVIKVAQKAGVPLVVASIKGTENISSRMPFRRTRVELSIIKVFSAEEVKTKRTAELGDEAFELIKNNLGEE